MNLEIEKKAKVENFEDIKEKLISKYNLKEQTIREDYYLVNNKGQEIRLSVIKYINNNEKVIEVTYKERTGDKKLEINQEYILFCNNEFSQVLEFWQALGFSQQKSKIKKYLGFETEILKIALVYFVEIKKNGEKFQLPNTYLEVECMLSDQNIAENVLNNFFSEMNLSEIEDKRYIDME